MKRHSFFILSLFLWLLPLVAAAQETVHGIIIDSENHQHCRGGSPGIEQNRESDFICIL